MVARVRGKVRGLGDVYTSGLERLEIHVNKDEGQSLPHEMGAKVPVQIIIGTHQYSGGIRSTEDCPYIWISPTFFDNDGQRTSLAEVLLREGIEKNQSIELEVLDDRVRVILQPQSSS